MIKILRSKFSLLGVVAASLVSAGCGGGGGSGGSPSTQLAFSVNWQQPSGAVGSIAASSAAEPLAFDTPIPASVNAIRFILRPDDGPVLGDGNHRVRFTVVDANSPIDPDIDVRILRGDVDTGVEILNTQECSDNDTEDELPDCSDNGALDVSGIRFTVRPLVELP